ncbi:hypothetical protein LMG28140_03613 [Paraburkholderia metrosideri]|jgi:hypothetical protein|uniref:Uncharacterized protein n=1 Tax=Paraburkholderia metrosideri TaxID=580937 RepID=A0ABN7HYK9_9BURK|nr:hypothetical protein LMG28140_03613 [Paraburkholderia metrosideri]
MRASSGAEYQRGSRYTGSVRGRHRPFNYGAVQRFGRAPVPGQHAGMHATVGTERRPVHLPVHSAAETGCLSVLDFYRSLIL